MVESFFAAADNHHLDALDDLLHPGFRLVVTRPDMGPQTLDKQEFMALMMDSMKEMQKRMNESKDEAGLVKGVETIRVHMITLLRNHVCRRLKGRKSRHQVQEERKKKEAQNGLL